MPISNEQIALLRKEYGTVPEKYQKLLALYVTRIYGEAEAHEHATQGFVRRLGTLVRSIDNVFAIVPPDRTDIPERDSLLDAAINIQAFVFNVFGCADNLAWIWVLEKHITKKDGSPLSPMQIGLTPKYDVVRGSFSRRFLSELEGLSKWFEYLENYRHALAHRIPLYIPPYTVSPANEAAYHDLEKKLQETAKDGNLAEYERLSTEQKKLMTFIPWIKHSFVEGSQPFWFHPQLLADFNTIVGLGERMIEELDR